MTELGPGDTAVADSKMSPAEMRLLCTLLGNNTIHAHTLLLAGLWLACTQRTLARSWGNFTFLARGMQAPRLETLAPRNSARHCAQTQR